MSEVILMGSKTQIDISPKGKTQEVDNYFYSLHRIMLVTLSKGEISFCHLYLIKFVNAISLKSSVRFNACPSYQIGLTHVLLIRLV